MDNTNSALDMSGLAYTKEKDWKELTSDEKIERMRTILKYTKKNLESADREIWDLRHKLARHSHNELGRTVTEISEYSELNGGSIGPSSSDNSYF